MAAHGKQMVGRVVREVVRAVDHQGTLVEHQWTQRRVPRAALQWELAAVEEGEQGALGEALEVMPPEVLVARVKPLRSPELVARSQPVKVV
jgi:hypothetical protein